MEILLDLIQPSPHPIRSSWDEGKMEELADSIKEQGLIVPIKVRPTDNEHYEVVYGHRRVEACRRAGWHTIDAIVEGLEDTDALIQALIENIQREDMEPMDLAHALKELQDQTGWSQREMARKGIMPPQTISVTMKLLDEAPEVQLLIRRGDPGPVTGRGYVTREHVTAAREAGTTPEQRVQLLQKAADEGLSYKETRRVAEAVAHAEDEAEREAILSTDPTSPMFERLVRVRADIHRESQRQQQKKREDDPREVRAFLDAVRAFRAVCREAVAVAEYGKFSPEARAFAIRQLDQLIDDIDALKVQLEV